MPCLNEARTIGACIEEAKGFIKSAGLSAEIIVVDNNSTDDSAKIAKEMGVRVIFEKKPGYGNALRAGLAKAKGKVIIMGDCDLTYDFSNLHEMYDLLQKNDVVIGDRFKGGIERGAMPLSHHVGVRGLSLMGRMRYGTDVKDFHCGLRGIRSDALGRVNYRTTGMEFATEMIAEAVRNDLVIAQTPVALRNSVKGRRPKLNTIRDGFRHLNYIIWQ